MEKKNKNLIDEIEFNSSLREKWFEKEKKNVHLSTMSAGVTAVVVAIIVVVVAEVYVVVAVAVVVVAKTESSIH